MKLLHVVGKEQLEPLLGNLCMRLRTAVRRCDVDLRAACFGALGAACRFGAGEGHVADDFLQQIMECMPWLLVNLRSPALAVRRSALRCLFALTPLLRGGEDRFREVLREYSHTLDEGTDEEEGGNGGETKQGGAGAGGADGGGGAASEGAAQAALLDAFFADDSMTIDHAVLTALAGKGGDAPAWLSVSVEGV